MRVFKAAQVQPRRCLWCKQRFYALIVDIKRGRARFDSVQCKLAYEKAQGGRGPNQGAKVKKATAIIQKAYDESFAEYDAICETEDSQ